MADTFLEEVRGYSLEDLELIVEDQEELYTAEEFAILKDELIGRKSEAERLARQQEAARKKEIYDNHIAALKARGCDRYYEYMTLSLTDDNGGGIFTGTIDRRLNELALEGWRLVSSYTNELGHNSTPGNVFAAGSNSTIDQHILILERFVKIS